MFSVQISFQDTCTFSSIYWADYQWVFFYRYSHTLYTHCIILPPFRVRSPRGGIRTISTPKKPTTDQVLMLIHYTIHSFIVRKLQELLKKFFKDRYWHPDIGKDHYVWQVTIILGTLLKHLCHLSIHKNTHFSYKFMGTFRYDIA